MKKTIFSMVVFFFIGMVSINAQYVPGDEAIEILKAETAVLEAQIPGATQLELIDLQFKIQYYKFVGFDINDGAEVGAAIQENQPTGKLKLHSNGWVSAQNDDPNLHQEIEDLVNYVDGLLSN